MNKIILTIVFAALSLAPLKAQLDDLMIVEYVDTDSPYNDGYGIKLYNPTNTTIDLSDYYIKLYHNGNANPSAGTTEQLTGMLSPGNIFVLGNPDYCDMCTSDCDFETISIQGVNSNDVVAFSKSSSNNTFVDMVGPYDTDVNSVVDDIVQALLHHKLIRECTNDIRYFNAASTSGPSNNSWYNNTNSMPGWIVDTISCLTHSNWNTEIDMNINDTSICLGDSILYDLSNLNSDSIQWNWLSDSSSEESLFLSDTGEYIVEVFDGCSGKDTFRINELNGEDVLSSGIKDTTFCEGDGFYTTISDLEFDNIIWTFKGSQLDKDSIFISDTGMYIVQVFAACGAIDTFNIDFKFIPEINISDTIICEGGSVFYDLSYLNSNLVIWSYNKTPTLLYGDTITFTKGGFYGVGGFLGCHGDEIESTSDTFRIEVVNCDSIEENLRIPNVFTPNQDEINDFFITKGLVNPIQIKIFNRWGKMVYQNEDYQNDWTGGNLPDGVYYYSIEDATESYKGWVNLIR